MTDYKQAYDQLRTAAERYYQFIERPPPFGRAIRERLPLSTALRAALDSTKPASEPEQLTPDDARQLTATEMAGLNPDDYRAERRETFDPVKVQELCDYIDEYKHCHGYLMCMVKAVRASEVKP